MHSFETVEVPDDDLSLRKKAVNIKSFRIKRSVWIQHFNIYHGKSDNCPIWQMSLRVWKVRNWLTWKPIWVFWPLAMYFPVFEIVMTEMLLSWPLKKFCFLEMMCLTTIVVPRGKMMCSLSGCKASPPLTLPKNKIQLINCKFNKSKDIMSLVVLIKSKYTYLGIQWRLLVLVLFP